MVFTDNIITIFCIILLFDFIIAAFWFLFYSLFFADTVSDTRIQHTTYASLYKHSSSDPMRMNNYVAKVEKMAKYLYPLGTKDGAPSEVES